MFRHHDEDDSNKKWRRHNDDIHDKDIENQQPSPHPMPPIVLPQAFLHAPNTFKPVSHIAANNNTRSTVCNFKNVVYNMRSCPKPQTLSLKIFYHYISVHCPKTQALSPKVFLPLYFRTLSQNPSFISKSVLPLYFRILSQNPSKVYQNKKDAHDQ